MKSASFSIAILNFFSRHGQYFHPTKDQPRTRLSSTFLYICYNFRQIFCTNVIQFFSVENMGHNQLKKCTKYHLVSLLNEKQRSTFANFWHLFIHVTLLTHSALAHLVKKENLFRRLQEGQVFTLFSFILFLCLQYTRAFSWMRFWHPATEEAKTITRFQQKF